MTRIAVEAEEAESVPAVRAIHMVASLCEFDRYPATRAWLDVFVALELFAGLALVIQVTAVVALAVVFAILDDCSADRARGRLAGPTS